MPTYEYRCKDCGHELEAWQSFEDDPLTECPSCKGTLKKKFGTVGIAFKGSGFYKTDSRSSSGSSTSTTSGDSSDAATSTDSKKTSSNGSSSSESSGSSSSGSSDSSKSSTTTKAPAST